MLPAVFLPIAYIPLKTGFAGFSHEEKFPFVLSAGALWGLLGVFSRFLGLRVSIPAAC